MSKKKLKKRVKKLEKLLWDYERLREMSRRHDKYLFHILYKRPQDALAEMQKNADWDAIGAGV